MIIMARIDNRLIHGQVVEGWLPSMNIDEVVVISPEYAASALAKKMFRMSLHSGYGLQVLAPKEAAEYLKQPNPARQFVLIGDVPSLKIMFDAGLALPKINIGNTRYEHGKREWAPGIYLSEDDSAFLKTIKENGAALDVRALPSSLPGRLF